PQLRKLDGTVWACGGIASARQALKNEGRSLPVLPRNVLPLGAGVARSLCRMRGRSNIALSWRFACGQLWHVAGHRRPTLLGCGRLRRVLPIALHERFGSTSDER